MTALKSGIMETLWNTFGIDFSQGVGNPGMMTNFMPGQIIRKTSVWENQDPSGIARKFMPYPYQPMTGTLKAMDNLDGFVQMMFVANNNSNVVDWLMTSLPDNKKKETSYMVSNCLNKRGLKEFQNFVRVAAVAWGLCQKNISTDDIDKLFNSNVSAYADDWNKRNEKNFARHVTTLLNKSVTSSNSTTAKELTDAMNDPNYLKKKDDDWMDKMSIFIPESSPEMRERALARMQERNPSLYSGTLATGG